MTTEISQIQLLANQENAKKSTGPRTEEGKNTARFNARRHGLTGQFFCMSEGDEIAWNTFQTNLLADLAPVGAFETQLAISVAQDQWRLNRSRGVENNLFGHGHARFAEETVAPSPNSHAASTMTDTFREDKRTFNLIALYETRLHRMATKNELRLKELQAERRAREAAAKALEDQAREEAELLTRLALMKGESPEPSAPIDVNGFVFSTFEILATIRREEALNEARFYRDRRWDASCRYHSPFAPPKAA